MVNLLNSLVPVIKFCGDKNSSNNSSKPNDIMTFSDNFTDINNLYLSLILIEYKLFLCYQMDFYK